MSALPGLPGGSAVKASVGNVAIGGTARQVAKLSAAVAEMADRAFMLQGVDAFHFTRRAAAVHEAGHVIMMLRDGTPPISVEIFKEDGCWGGRCGPSISNKITAESTEVHLSSARHTIVGLVAESLILGGTKDFALGSSIDEHVSYAVCIQNAAREIGCSAEELYITTIAEVINILSVNRSNLLRIASALFQKKKIKNKPLQNLLQSITIIPQ